MADYNYLELVNTLNRRLNEVELTSANFSTAVGYYAQAKDAINASIRHINQQEFEWPFNHVEQEDTLTAGTTRYPFPADTKVIDWESFRIQQDDTIGNDTKKLVRITYDEYLQSAVDQEYETSTSKRDLPRYVFMARNFHYGMVPAPDAAYPVTYEYYCAPVDLILYSDVPTIPERFKHVISEGAMYYTYMFRGNLQAAGVALQMFEAGIKTMQTMLINDFVRVSSTMISQNTGSNTRLGVAIATSGSSLDNL